MTNLSEKSTDNSVSKTIIEDRQSGIHTESAVPKTKPFPDTSLLQPTEGQEMIRPSPVEVAIQDAIKTATPSSQEKKSTPAAERFRNIAKHDSDPRPQGV